MLAVFVSGGKQHEAVIGRKLKLEKLNYNIGDNVIFDKVLLVSNDSEVKIGNPHVENAKVEAKILSQGRHKKIKIIKFKRRKHHMKQMGHRQYFTEVEITAIN